MTGPAQRRRQRRLRSWWRHEQQSIAAALATSLHHSSRGQRKARAGEVESEKKYTAKFRKTLPPQAFFQLYDEEDAERGVRPAAVLEPRPQGPVHRHTALNIVDVLPYVQILDVPVLQMGGELVEFMQNLDTSILDEQVIAVPKIFLDRIPQRSASRRMQKAEQLVEVPTEPMYALAVVASKVFSRRELRGILSGQGSTASESELSEQIVDNPVPQGRRGRDGGLQGSRSHARQNSTAADVEQIVDIPARGGLPDFPSSPPRPGFHSFLIESIA